MAASPTEHEEIKLLLGQVLASQAMLMRIMAALNPSHASLIERAAGSCMETAEKIEMEVRERLGHE